MVTYADEVKGLVRAVVIVDHHGIYVGNLSLVDAAVVGSVGIGAEVSVTMEVRLVVLEANVISEVAVCDERYVSRVLD